MSESESTPSEPQPKRKRVCASCEAQMPSYARFCPACGLAPGDTDKDPPVTKSQLVEAIDAAINPLFELLKKERRNAPTEESGEEEGP